MIDMSESQLMDRVREAKDKHSQYFPEGLISPQTDDHNMILLAKNVTKTKSLNDAFFPSTRQDTTRKGRYTCVHHEAIVYVPIDIAVQNDNMEENKVNVGDALSALNGIILPTSSIGNSIECPQYDVLYRKIDNGVAKDENYSSATSGVYQRPSYKVVSSYKSPCAR